MPAISLGAWARICGMLGITAGLLAVMALVGGVRTWFAADHLHDAAVASFAGNDRAARLSAERASGWRATVASELAAIDLQSPSAASELDRLLPRATPPQRELVRQAKLLQQLIQGQKPSDIDGPAAKVFTFIAACAAAQAGPLPSWPETEAALQLPILQLACEAQLAAAWRLGELPALAAAAGRLLTLAPEHPAAGHARLLAAWLSSSNDKHQLNRALGGIRDMTVRVALLRRLAAVAPQLATILPADSREAWLQERRRLTADMIPAQQRSEAEQALVAKTPTRPASKSLRERAEASGDPALVAEAIAEAIANHEPAAARKLTELLPASAQEEAKLLVALRAWDLSYLQRLGPAAAQFLPEVRGLSLRDSTLRFHLCDAFGRFPNRGVEVQLDGRVVPEQQIFRLGSAWEIHTGRGGAMQLSLHLDRQVFFREQVRP